MIFAKTLETLELEPSFRRFVDREGAGASERGITGTRINKRPPLSTTTSDIGRSLQQQSRANAFSSLASTLTIISLELTLQVKYYVRSGGPTKTEQSM